MAFKNVLLLGFSLSAKPNNLRTIQLEVEMHFLAIFLHLYVVIGIPNTHVKGHFN